MEVETEGKRGWMYDSQTQCSGILAFTWYHIIMNLIAMMTVTFIIRPNIVDKTPDEIRQTFVVWFYNLLVWFIVEDVGWFVVNRMTYRTAPWQTTLAAVLSTALPVLLVVYMYMPVLVHVVQLYNMRCLGLHTSLHRFLACMPYFKPAPAGLGLPAQRAAWPILSPRRSVPAPRALAPSPSVS